MKSKKPINDAPDCREKIKSTQNIIKINQKYYPYRPTLCVTPTLCNKCLRIYCSPFSKENLDFDK